MQHLLIDFENLQPKQLDSLINPELNIWLFIGAHQKKMDICLSESLCQLQANVKNIHFIHTVQAGKNSLDFCLTYYLGRIISEDKNADITILSKDTDYDSIISQIRHEQTAKNIRRKTIVPQKQLAQEAAEVSVQIDIPLAAFRTILYKLVNYPQKLPKNVDKFKKILKSLVKKELGIKDKEQRKIVIKQIKTKLIQYGLMEKNDQELTFSLSKKDFEKRLLNEIIARHPRTILALNNVIQQHINNRTYLEYSPKLAEGIIALLQHQNLLQINGNRLHYPNIDGELVNKQNELSEHAIRIVVILKKCNSRSLPQKEAALRNSMRSWLGRNTKDQLLNQLIHELINFNYLVITNNGMVTYQL